MIISDRLVFLHLHKSGGTFVNQFLLNCVPSARQIGYHLPYSELPEPYRALPVMGTVRNPWAYYVSWYFFQSGQAKPNPLFRICSDDGQLGFEASIGNLLNLHQDDARVDRLAAALPERFGKAGLNLTRSCIQRIRGSGIGFYSFLYQRLYAGADAPRLLRVESLRQDLQEALSEIGQPMDARATQFLTEIPPLNRSAHGPVRDYYGSALRDAVARADAGLVDGHGYVF